MKFYFTLFTLLLSFQAQAADKKSTTNRKPTNANEVSYRKEGKNYLIVLKPGQKVIESLSVFMEKEKLPGATFTAIGGVKNANIGYYNLKTNVYQPKLFQEPLELLSLIGNIGYHEKKPVVHAHIAVSGDDYKAYGGHLLEAEVTVTLEVMITPTVKPLIREMSTEFPNAKLINLDAK